MDQQVLYDNVCIRTSRLVTRSYSTSFSIGIRCLASNLRDPIYSIYGFVRLADEIVDTFHEHDKVNLLRKFKEDTWNAIDNKISTNPVLQSFQRTVHELKLERAHIELFLKSMEMDLDRKQYDQPEFEKYILGSAEAVGLMCLKVFCHEDETRYQRLKPYAMKLGAAFQKINFLRDLRADYAGMGRSYFPGLDVERFDEETKKRIEADIESDFQEGYRGIQDLPRGAKMGVYVAYRYYRALFRKIKRLPSSAVLQSRVSVRKRYKIAILGYSFLKHQFNLI